MKDRIFETDGPLQRAVFFDEAERHIAALGGEWKEVT